MAAQLHNDIEGLFVYREGRCTHNLHAETTSSHGYFEVYSSMLAIVVVVPFLNFMSFNLHALIL